MNPIIWIAFTMKCMDYAENKHQYFMFLFSSGGLEITVEGKNLNASMAPKLGGTFEVDGNMYEFGAESVSLIKHNS